MIRNFEAEVTVRIRVRGQEEIEDGITRAEWYQIVDRIRESCETAVEQDLVTFDVWDIECEIPDFTPHVEIDDSPQHVPVPDDCWIEWRGHRWATDGAVLIREDCPVPPLNPQDPTRYWRPITVNHIEEHLSRYFDDASAGKLSRNIYRKFASRMQGLLRYGTAYGEADHGAPVVLRSHGENVALIMPVDCDFKVVQSDIHGRLLDACGDEVTE